MAKKRNLKNVFLVLGMLSAGASFVSAASYLSDSQNLTIVEASTIHDLNPQTTAYTSDTLILSGLYEGLFAYNPQTLEPEPALAVEYRISRNKKRWNFTLREDAYFSNGEKITPQAVRASFLKLLANPKAPYASLLDMIKGAADYHNGLCDEEKVGITVSGENKITFSLTSPANYLARVLCHSAFSIVHENPEVYSGPFAVDSISSNQIVLRKNDYYWDKQNVKLESITFLQSDDPEENAMLYNAGFVQWLATGNVVIDKLLNKKAVQYSAEFGTAYLFFKMAQEDEIVDEDSEIMLLAPKNPIWNKVEFRNAVLEAMPWDIIHSQYTIPATTFVFPLNGYPQVNGFSYSDSTEALLMMQEAREMYGIPEDEILPLVLELPVNGFTEQKKDAIKQALEPLGIDLQIRELPSYEYIRNVPVSDADMFIYIWIGDFADPLAFLELFRGNSSLNDSRWQNDEYDALLAQAAEVPQEKRFEILAKAEELLLDNGLVVPVYHPVSFNVINTEEVGGWFTNAFDYHSLKYLYLNCLEKQLPNVVLNTLSN